MTQDVTSLSNRSLTIYAFSPGIRVKRLKVVSKRFLGLKPAEMVKDLLVTDAFLILAKAKGVNFSLR